MQLLWAVDHGLRSCSKRMQVELGLTGPQRLALRMVGSFPGLAPSELADLLHVDRGTLTGILARLLGRGLVLREDDPDDGRRSKLWLSARGKKLNSVAAGTIEAKVQRALGSLDSDQVHAAKQVLEALAVHLSASKGRAPRTARKARARKRSAA